MPVSLCSTIIGIILSVGEMSDNGSAQGLYIIFSLMSVKRFLHHLRHPIFIRSRRDHTGYPVPMDDLEGLSFGYQLPEDVTSAVRRAYRKGNTLSAGADLDNLGPFVYHAEGITFAFVEHMGSQGGGTNGD